MIATSLLRQALTRVCVFACLALIAAQPPAAASPFPSSIDLGSLNGSTGFRLDGINPDDLSGVSVSGAGDVNGDGIDDLIVGAYAADPNGDSGAGESYVVFGSNTGFTASIDLGSLDGSTGFRLDGINSADNAGWSVSGAGDVNGDGIDDLIIGAYAADPNDNNSAGESYVLFGSNTGFTASIDLGSLNGSTGFRLDGIDPDDQSGWSVSGAGDVNSDGLDDLIVGAWRADPNGDSNAGESYVVFGSNTGFPASIDLGSLNGSTGFRLDGIDPDDHSGWRVSGAGDVNGDGIDDLIVAAYSADPNGDSNAGESYVVFGTASGFPASIDLASLNGGTGFRLDGIDPDDQSGRSVSGAGDVNGDGIDDLIVGARFGDPDGDTNAGESYVIFGTTAGFPASIDLASLNGSTGFRLDGIDPNEESGYSVSGAGDVNGDGIEDLIVGAWRADANGDSLAGESYVVFGSAAGFPASVDLASLNGATGFRLDGIDPSDLSGRSVAGAGDVNGDGIDDLIVGAWAADPNGDDNAGESYVVFGRSDGPDSTIRVGSEWFDNNEELTIEIQDAASLSGFDRLSVYTLDLSRLDPQRTDRNFEISLFSRGATGLDDIAPWAEALNFDASQDYAFEIVRFDALLGSFEADDFTLLTSGFLNDLLGGIWGLEQRFDNGTSGPGGLFVTFTAFDDGSGAGAVPAPAALALLLVGLTALRRR